MERALRLLPFSSPLKRFYKFLLKKVLGNFLQYDLDMHQLDVQLAKGEIELRDLEINVQMLNELCADLPLTFIRARIRLVRASIPWRSLLSTSCVLKLDGWDLVVVPSEQVQPKASVSLSSMLAQSVLSVGVDHADLELQKSLASLGRHFRQHAGATATPATPMSTSGINAFGTPARHRDALEEAEERRHEAATAAAVRAREKRRKQAEQRRLRREALGDEDDDEYLAAAAAAAPNVHVESDVNTDDEQAEEAASVRQHTQRQAAAMDTANQGLKVVASFLEQVVSAIELEVTDISIRVQHQPRAGSKQTSLTVKLPWIKFEDLNKTRAQQEQAAAEQKQEHLAEELKEAEARVQLIRERRAAARQRRDAERQRRQHERAARRAAAAAGQADGAFGDAADVADDASDGDADAHLEDAALEEAEDEAALARDTAKAAAAASAQGGISGSFNFSGGPRYEYHKSIRFHGFRVELHEEPIMECSMGQSTASSLPTGAAAAAAFGGGLPLTRTLSEAEDDAASDVSAASFTEPQTLISGSMDQECVITLKLKMQDQLLNEPRIEARMFIQSLRALITPRQLALISDLAAAIGLSAKQVAINAQLAQQIPAPQGPIVLNPAGGFSPSVQSAALKLQQAQGDRAGAAAAAYPDFRDRPSVPSSHGAFSDVPFSSAPASQQTAVGAEQIVNLWSMETHILHSSLTLMQSDEQTWPTDWWSAPPTTTDAQPQHDPEHGIVQSTIPGLSCNHLLLAVHHTFLTVNQTSAEATLKLTLGALQLAEFLVQQRAPPRSPGQPPPVAFAHRAPRASDAEWIGFKARPLISFAGEDSLSPPSLQFAGNNPLSSFEQATRPVADPHLSIELRSSVDSSYSLQFNEPLGKFFEPHLQGCTISSRLTLSCQPATIHFDLGLGSRLKHILDAVAAPLPYLLGNASHPPSATHAHSEHASFSFDTQRTQAAAAPSGSMAVEEMLQRLAQQRHTEARHPDGASFSQTVILAPSIHFNILFPATTASQLQPHPYTRMELLAQSPFIDARGVLRPERIEFELHEVSVVNEIELPGSGADAHDARAASAMPPAQDAEWLIRFLRASTFMHYPHIVTGTEASLDEMDVLSKRLLSTVYPSLQPQAFYSFADAVSYVSILTRAPPHHVPPRFHPADHSSADAQRAEQMFFDGLPNVPFWEPQILNGERQRVFNPSSQNASGGGGGDEDSQGPASQSPQQPNAAIFETAALANSGLVVTVHLPVAAVHLSKSDYDLLMFLVGIYLEVSDPNAQQPAALEEVPVAPAAAGGADGAAFDAAHQFAASFAPQQALHESGLSAHDDPAADEEDDQVDVNGLARSVRYHHPSASYHAGGGGLDADALPDAHSLSRSDSGSSDSSSEMFESVVGADSVILKHVASPPPMPHRSKLLSPPRMLAQSASGSLLRPNSVMLPSLEELRISNPSLAASSASSSEQPLAGSPSASPPGPRLTAERKGNGDDADDEEDDEDDRQAARLLEEEQQLLHSRSSSPRSARSTPPLPAEQRIPDDPSRYFPSNLSDASEDDSLSGSVGDLPHHSQLLRSPRRRDEEDEKHVAFGATSILMPPQRGSSAGEAAESDRDSDSNAASMELNPAAIFDRASRTSGQSQLLRPPGLAVSTALPPVSELVHSSSLAASHLMRSSMVDSPVDPAMFESFRQPPSSVFDPRASMQASVDYGHLQPAPLSVLPLSSLLVPPQRSVLSAAPLTARTVADQPIVAAPVARAANAPYPLNSASAFPAPPPPVAPAAPARVPSYFRHFMSLRLRIQRASIVLQDDPARDPHAPQPAVVPVPPAPGAAVPSPPQTFHVDIGEVRMFMVSEYNGQPVNYIALRAGDLTLREYQAVITDERQLFLTPSMPIIFKTMGDGPQDDGQQHAHEQPHQRPQRHADPWALPYDMERKYDDEGDYDAQPPLPGLGPDLHRQDSTSTSTAWKNPVLLLNFVIKLQPELNVRDTQAVVNLRALTLQFFPESKWIQKLMAFFLPTLYAPAVAPPMFNVAAPVAPPPPPPLTKEVIHVHLHAYDVSLDYNPVAIAPRAVVSLDHVHLQTTVYPDSSLSTIKIELRDLAVFMVPHSSKAHYSTTMFLNEIGQPFLHRIGAASLFAQLEALGYARLATLDVLDVVIAQNASEPNAAPAVGVPKQQQLPHTPDLSVEVSNGALSILTCSDSFNVLIAVATHFANSVVAVTQVAEVEVAFQNEEVRSQVMQRQQQAAAAAAAYPISSAPHHRAAYLLDDDEDEDAAEEERKGDDPVVQHHSEHDSNSSQPRNILDELDHNAFGADLGVAQVFQSEPLELRVNENYHDEQTQKTSLSLALQAAAERELARARREALGEDHFSVANAAAAAAAPARAEQSPSGPAHDQRARWLTTRESDDLVERDRHDRFILSLANEDERRREEQLAAEKEERRRRREEAKAAEEANGVLLHNAKDQRRAPSVIDDHVPLADDDTRTGRARLKPPPDYPLSVSTILLVNCHVVWRMFGGRDWDIDAEEGQQAAASATQHAQPVSQHAPASAAAFVYPPPGESAQLYGGSVDINEFYAAHEPFVKPPRGPQFASPTGRSTADLAGVRMPNEPYRLQQRAAVAASSLPESLLLPPLRGTSSPDVVARGHRQTDRVMEVVLSGVNVRFDAFPSGVQIASRLVVALDNIAVHDLIAASPFNLFLGYYARAGSKGRELGSSMIRIDMTSVRPDPSRAREELRVKVSVLPLRLNVDQAAVEFFIQFFSPPKETTSADDRAKSAAVEEGIAAAMNAQMGAQAQVAPGQFLSLYTNEDAPHTPAEADVLVALTALLLQPHSMRVSHIVNTAHARVLCVDMEKRNLLQAQTLADAVQQPLANYIAWKNGGGHEQTVGAAMVQLLNRLLRPARASPDEDEADSSDEEDEHHVAGMGGGAHSLGANGGRTPLRRLSSDPLETYQAFRVPPMPHDFVPVVLAHRYPNLVPSVHEAYSKYYDTIHASMPAVMPNEIEPWRPAPALFTPASSESSNEFRTRVVAAARAAARTQLKRLGATAVREVDNETYIQSFHVSSIVLCVDWKPNSFNLADLRAGDYAQLANLLPLESLEIELIAAKLTGITGFDRVGAELAQLWAYDISRHQAHRYLASVQPIRSLVNVGGGVADLVLLPLQHYRQHGSIKRGVQRGLSSFLRNVTLESMAATARLAQGAQTILETVDDVLTYRPAPLPSHAHSQFAQQRARNARRGARGASAAAAAAADAQDAPRRKTYLSKRANPPGSAAEGLRQAYESLSRGLQSAASQMIVVPREEYQRSGSRGAVRSALRSMPGAVLSPVIGGVEAIGKVLNGAASSLAPNRVQEHRDRYKPHLK